MHIQSTHEITLFNSFGFKAEVLSGDDTVSNHLLTYFMNQSNN